MNTFTDRQAWASKHAKEQKEILGQHFNTPVQQISNPTFYQDACEATDLILPNGTRIGMRIRTYGQRARFYGQFTIREIELPKIRSGRVAYMLYGFANEADTGIESWWLIDLKSVVRQIDG